MVKHNQIPGPTPLLSTTLNQYLNAIKINFKYNIQNAISCEEFKDMTPTLKNRLLQVITFREQKTFYNMFNDMENGFEMPQNLISALLKSLSLEEIEDGKLIITPGDEFQNFYMIKMGAVQIFDKDYAYLYNLESGSFFGESNILLGLYSDLNYKPMTRQDEAQTIIFKIKA